MRDRCADVELWWGKCSSTFGCVGQAFHEQWQTTVIEMICSSRRVHVVKTKAYGVLIEQKHSTAPCQKFETNPAFTPHQQLNVEYVLEFYKNRGYYTFDLAPEAVLIS